MGNSELTIITSQGKKQWESYGRYSIESFLKHWPKNCVLHVYTEDYNDIKHDSNRIKIIDLKKLDNEYLKFNNDPTVWRRAKIFSHKAWAIMDILKNKKQGYLVWLDCDVVTKEPITKNWIIDLCPKKYISAHLGQYQHLRNGKEIYSAETGCFILNLEHKLIDDFYNEYRRRYVERDWNNCKKPFDTDVFGNAMMLVKSKGAVWNELSPDPTLLLLSPFNKSVIGERLFHYKAKGKKVMEKKESKS